MTFESTEYGVVDEDNFEEHRIIHRHGDNVGQVPSQLLEYIAEESPVSSNVAYLEDVNYFEEGQNQLDALLFH